MTYYLKILFRGLFFCLLILCAITIVYAISNYEKLTPEAKKLLTLSEDETSQTQSTTQFLSTQKDVLVDGYQLAKTHPCRSSTESSNKKDFITQWEQYLQKSQFAEKRLQPYLNQTFFSSADGHLVKLIGQINQLRELHLQIAAHSCYLKLSSRQKEANKIDFTLFQIHMNSLKAPNINLSNLINLSSITHYLDSSKDQTHKMELKKLIQNLLDSETADSLFWKSTRYDIIMMVQTVESQDFHEDSISRLANWLLPMNQFKNKITKPLLNHEIPKTERNKDEKSYPYYFISNVMDNYQAISYSRLNDSRERFRMRWDQLKKFVAKP